MVCGSILHLKIPKLYDPQNSIQYIVIANLNLIFFVI